MGKSRRQCKPSPWACCGARVACHWSPGGSEDRSSVCPCSAGTSHPESRLTADWAVCPRGGMGAAHVSWGGHACVAPGRESCRVDRVSGPGGSPRDDRAVCKCSVLALAQAGLRPATSRPAGRACPGQAWGTPGGDHTAQPQGAGWVDSSPASAPAPAPPAVRAVRGPSRASPACGSLRGARRQSAGSEAGQDQTRRVMGIGILY